MKSDSANVANPGLVRPPIVYLCAIVTGFIINVIWPIQYTDVWLSTLLGFVLLGLAFAIFMSAQHEFKNAETPIPGNKPTTAIICTGPFRFTRNPIYVAFTLIQLGVAFVFQNIWVAATLAFSLTVINNFVIPREEKHMALIFGSEYAKYKNSVRRWL